MKMIQWGIVGMVWGLLIVLGMFLGEAQAEIHPFHDAHVITHDVRAIHTGHDHELSKLFRDARHDIGIPNIHHHDNNDHHGSELSKFAELLGLDKKLKKDECDRLHVEYTFRHPPGTKPEGLKGSHGCTLWKRDAHFHDVHPNVVSVLGANFDITLPSF